MQPQSSEKPRLLHNETKPTSYADYGTVTKDPVPAFPVGLIRFRSSFPQDTYPLPSKLSARPTPFHGLFVDLGGASTFQG